MDTDEKTCCWCLSEESEGGLWYWLGGDPFKEGLFCRACASDSGGYTPTSRNAVFWFVDGFKYEKRGKSDKHHLEIKGGKEENE